MKRGLIFIAMLFLTLPLAGLDFKDIPLENSEWSASKSSWVYLYIYPDHYRIDGVGDGRYVLMQGQWKIQGNRLTLTPKPSSDYEQNPKWIMKTTVWVLEEDKESVFFYYKITATDIDEVFWCLSITVPEGTLRKWPDFDVITLNSHKTAVLDNARVRKGPGTSYAYIAFPPIPLPTVWDGKRTATFLPKGYGGVTVLARNTVKSTIEGVSDYWYYCRVGYDNGGDYGGEEYGWIFGGLISE